MQHLRRSLLTIACAIVMSGMAAVLTFAAGDPVSPSDPSEPGVDRQTIMTGAIGLGDWRLSGGLAADGSLCADMTFSGTVASFGACGLEFWAAADAQVNDNGTGSPCPDWLTAQSSTSRTGYALGPNCHAGTPLIKVVQGLDPEAAITSVFGSVPPRIADVKVNVAGRTVNFIPSGPELGVKWFATATQNLEAGAHILINAYEAEGQLAYSTIMTVGGAQADRAFRCRDSLDPLKPSGNGLNTEDTIVACRGPGPSIAVPSELGVSRSGVATVAAVSLAQEPSIIEAAIVGSGPGAAHTAGAHARAITAVSRAGGRPLHVRVPARIRNRLRAGERVRAGLRVKIRKDGRIAVRNRVVTLTPLR